MTTTINRFYETNRGWKIFGSLVIVGGIIWVIYRLYNNQPVFSFTSTAKPKNSSPMVNNNNEPAPTNNAG